MKKLILIFALTTLLIPLLILLPRLTSQQLKTEGSSNFYYAPGKIVIQFTKEVSPVIPWEEDGIIHTGIGSVDELCQKFKVHTMRRQFPAPKYPFPDLTRHFVVKFDESINLDKVVDAFSKNPFIEKAERVGVHKFLIQPNDPKYPQQWALHNTGQAGGKVDADIDAPEAWNIQKGSKSVILAIPDSGVLYTHPDLKGNIWINWKEKNGTPNYDDDGNGYIDDIYGWDWYENDNDPTDEDEHGTPIAGIAAAMTNNNTGVAGIAGGWYLGQKGCRIMCLRIGYKGADMSNAASAIQYATDMGAFAINCSWESSSTGTFPEAVDYAIRNKVLVVVAAGNANGNYCNDTNNNYLSTRSDVMVVAATNIEDKKARYSNYGPCVDVSAPGGDGPYKEQWILTTILNNDYGYYKGTSYAAPMVVGLAGLIKSQRPAWGRSKIWNAIVKSADYIYHLNPDYKGKLGSGRINAHYALKQTWSPAAPSNLTAKAVAYNQINLSWKDNSNNELGFKIQRKKAGGTFSTIKTVGRNVTSYKDKSVSANTTYYYRVRAYNVNGNSSFSNTASATTPPKPAPPAAPSNLTATAKTSYRIDLAWKDNSNNEDGFKIERKIKNVTSFSQIAKVGRNVTSYSDTSCEPATTYCYRVRAYNASGNSSYSNTACATTFPEKPEPPEPPFPKGIDLGLSVDKTIINSGESVTFTYTITNIGRAKLTDVVLEDSFGHVAEISRLPSTGKGNYTRNVILTETTTNTATVIAVYHIKNKIGNVKATATITVEVRE